MARSEADREDLLAEAKALVERVELRCATQRDSDVVGFRRQGAISFYFGGDFVLQFNAADELRRGFYLGSMLVARDGRLITLTRKRDGDVVHLESHALSAAETAVFWQAAEQQLRRLRETLAAQDFELVGQVPANVGVTERVQKWLEAHPFPLRIAKRPHVGQ